jgi:HAD superfamily hydrolase (TIGR01509 family)
MNLFDCNLALTNLKAQDGRHRRIRAVLFDLNGVVIDSEPVLERTLVVASEHLGHELTYAELMRLKGLNQAASAAALQTIASSNVDCARIVSIRSEAFSGLLNNVCLMPHVLRFISRLRRSGFALALTTSSGHRTLARIFQRFGLSQLFDVVVAGDDVRTSKPDPEAYLLAAERLGLPPEHCLAIEDSVNGVTSASAAGCQVIGITTSFGKEELKEAGAAIAIDNFEELEQILFSASPALS